MTAKRKVASVLNAVKTYDGLNVVDDVSFNLFAGQTTVLVGPNGSGKTTMLEMLVGLRSMSKGSATIADIPVVPGGEHRFYTGVQLQSSGIPSRIKTKEVIRSVECLYADPADWKAMATALGVDTYLDAMVDNLSGGQRQRLALARALLHNSQMYIFDEATSNIDVESEDVIMQQVHQLAQTKMVLVISHRLVNVKNADQIVVMQHGRVVGSGTHQELLATNDEYKRMTQAQTELENYVKGVEA